MKPVLATIACGLTLLCAPAHAGGFRSLVGAWTVSPDINGSAGPVINLASLDANGTLINSDPLFGTGIGTWELMSRRRIATEFLTLVPVAKANELVAAGTLPACAFVAPPGPPLILRVAGEAKVRFRSETLKADFTTTFEDQSGSVLCEFSGGVILTRIGDPSS